MTRVGRDGGKAVVGEETAREKDLYNLSSRDEWTVLGSVVDSGAADTWALVGMSEWIPLTSQQESTDGPSWQTACRYIFTSSMGETQIQGANDDGTSLETATDGKVQRKAATTYFLRR